MRRAFTMIELLTVMAIMAMLGVAATGGYAALQRGMRERAAVAAASALLRSAKERAAVDRVPTAVFCYNKLLREANATSDEGAVVVGVMTAIRRAGRLSFVGGNFLYDEFGDLEHGESFEVLSDKKELSTDGMQHTTADLEKRAGIRLWRFPTSASMEYSIVADAVWLDDSRSEVLFSGANGGSTNCLMGAYYNLKKSRHEPSWKVGTPYAFEIGELQLPHGFIFGESGIPSTVGGIEVVKKILFNPEDDTDESVVVSMTRTDASGAARVHEPAGTATSSESKNL